MSEQIFLYVFARIYERICACRTVSVRETRTAVHEWACWKSNMLHHIPKEKISKKYSSNNRFNWILTGAFKNQNGPNNRNGPGITGTDLSFTYFFSVSIFIFQSYVQSSIECRSLEEFSDSSLVYETLMIT